MSDEPQPRASRGPSPDGTRPTGRFGRLAPPGRLTPLTRSPGNRSSEHRQRTSTAAAPADGVRTATVPPTRPITRTRRAAGLDMPLENRRTLVTPRVDAEFFGRLSERFARFMGTARFIFYMTVFVGLWLAWNTFGPPGLQFDPRALNYTLLTLILSLQASYAAPLILLAQNRQDDRDRVAFEQDRQRAERSLADTEYLAREIVALRIALRDVATRDFVRSELRDLLAELAGPDQDAAGPE
jgi:uncharacterized membrane protein